MGNLGQTDFPLSGMVLQSWLLVAHLEGYLSGQAPKGGLQGPDTTRGRCLDPHFFTNLRQAQLARLLIYFYLQNIPIHRNTVTEVSFLIPWKENHERLPLSQQESH